MKKEHAAPEGARQERRRKRRPRPMPRWLESSSELDALARSRCLMVLSVLSGEKPVSEAIEEAKISRGTYYQLETRALKGMLAALNPLSSIEASGSPQPSAEALTHIARLQERVQSLEQDKRRADRLLLLTRKAMRLPSMVPRRGRPPKTALPYLTRSSRPHSKPSKAKASPGGSSTPTAAGESVR